MTDSYRIRPADIWVQAREDYLSGLSAETVCRRHDLGLSAFRRRARKYGWRRSDQVEPPPGEADLSLYADLTMEDQIDTARLRFLEALEIGKATEARRWRSLWLELCDARHALDMDIFDGMSPAAITAALTADAEADETGDEVQRLGPPPTTPRLSDSGAAEMCTKVHSKILPTPDPA
tara:strand:+ start:190 stop:723 length:534 start_codon:yes stop_codon:yes gene_type:complete